MELELTVVPDGLRFAVLAKPRASRSRVLGVKAGALEVAIAAPPVDGAANAELLKSLAKALGLSKSQVSLVAGETSKHKRVVVHGIEPAAFRERLAAAIG